MKSFWQVESDFASADMDVPLRSLDGVFNLTGTPVTRDSLSEVIHLQLGGKSFYLKRYYLAGKRLRRYIGRPRVRGEWRNLLRFAEWGLPTARVVAFGMERRGPFFKRGALITEEMHGTEDLARLADRRDLKLYDRRWIEEISRQLSHCARVMHAHRFTHGDFKWRNILVATNGAPQIYLIDCPSGRFWFPPFLQYRKNKDLASLDKFAQKVLTRSQRLRFYLDYLGKERLSPKDKRQVRKILACDPRG